MFGRNKKTVDDVNVQYPHEYGFPRDQFDFPYMVTEDDARVESYDYGDSGAGTGTSPFKYESNESFDQFQPILSQNQGVYKVAFASSRSLVPSNDQVSRVPAAGSTDLAEPMDTPYYAPGTNTLIRSDGPVHGAPPRFDGDVQHIGRDVVGVGGPVTGDGSVGYSNGLAASYAAAQFNAFSAEAATSALVSAV